MAFSACQNQQKNETGGSASDTSATVRIPAAEKRELTQTDTITSIRDKETKFTRPSGVPLGVRTLKDFELHGNGRTKKVNDSLFVEFLKSFTTYQNEVNDRLFDDPDYDIYNTLVYADDELVKPEAKHFEDSVKELGFSVAMTEGMIFLEKDPVFLNKFSRYLSERMNIFRDQYAREIERPLASDGGLRISTDEQIDRILFWEHFAKKHADFELPEYANRQFRIYLFYFMFGMDNTPIHDWSDSLNVRPEMIDLYKSVIAKNPNSKAAGYLSDYLDFLDQKDFRYDSSFDAYGRGKFPEMYGN